MLNFDCKDVDTNYLYFIWQRIVYYVTRLHITQSVLSDVNIAYLIRTFGSGSFSNYSTIKLFIEGEKHAFITIKNRHLGSVS